MADLISIGLALDTSAVLQGTKQVDAALKSVAAASTSTAQATQKMDAAAKTAGQALTAESQAAQATANALKQTATASQAASQAAQAAAKAAHSVADALRQTDKAAQGASQQLGSMGNSLRGFASQTASFALAQAGVAGFQQAITTAKDAVVDLVRTGIQMQQLRQSFTAASGSAQAGAKDFQFVVKTANQLGLEIKSVAEQYRSLSAATRGTSLQGADTRELFVTLSKAAQAYGLSTEQLGRAMTAFQQIISKGKVSMEELRGQLGEAIPGAMQIAARAYGTNTQALEEMISKGVDAASFTRRFMAQLGAEVPAAADRAGKGIQQFGNEIVLLKDAMANSGLIRWIDTIIGKLAELLRLGREGEEKLQRGAERQAARAAGGPEIIEKYLPAEKARLDELTRRMRDDEAILKALEKTRGQPQPGGGIPPLSANLFPLPVEEPPSQRRATRTPLSQTMTADEEKFIRRRIEADKEELALLNARARLGKEEREERARRTAAQEIAAKDQASQSEAVDKATKQHKADLDGVKTSMDTLNKSASLAPEIYGKATGPLKEQNVYLAERIKLQEKALETATKTMLERPTAQPLPAEQLKQHEALRKSLSDDRAQLERNKQAIEDLAKAETTRLADLEKAKAKAEQDDEDNARKSLVRLKELDAADEQNIEQLRRLAAQYTEVKATRDEDTASTLAASLATSQYAKESRGLAEAIADVQRIEAKLPALRSEAAGSAERLSNINRAMQQFEPRRRGESTEARLTRSYADLAQEPGVSMGKLSEASEKIREALDTEMWDKWRDVGLDALSHVGDALTEFAFKGKLTFKDMLSSIAQDIFRASLQMVTQQATKKGGWLEMGLDLGLKALGIAAGSFGAQPGSGTLPTTWGQYNTMSAAGAFSGRQHGGPVSAGVPYLVGEKGPELVVPRTSGTVVPAGQAQAPMQVVNHFHITTPDANSFTQSRGAVSRAIMSSLTQARQQL